MAEKEELFQSQAEQYEIEPARIFEFIARLTNYATEQCMIYKGAKPDELIKPIRASGFQKKFVLLAVREEGILLGNENLADVVVREGETTFTIHEHKGLRVDPGPLYSLGEQYNIAAKTVELSEE